MVSLSLQTPWLNSSKRRSSNQALLQCGYRVHIYIAYRCLPIYHTLRWFPSSISQKNHFLNSTEGLPWRPVGMVDKDRKAHRQHAKKMRLGMVSEHHAHSHSISCESGLPGFQHWDCISDTRGLINCCFLEITGSSKGKPPLAHVGSLSQCSSPGQSLPRLAWDSGHESLPLRLPGEIFH